MKRRKFLFLLTFGFSACVSKNLVSKRLFDLNKRKYLIAHISYLGNLHSDGFIYIHITKTLKVHGYIHSSTIGFLQVSTQWGTAIVVDQVYRTDVSINLRYY